MIDPLYALVRREPVATIPRPNTAWRGRHLALAGPWGHVPLILAGRNIKFERRARRGRASRVPLASSSGTGLEYRQILRWINQTARRGPKGASSTAVRQNLRRRARTCVHRGRKLRQLTASTIGHLARARPTVTADSERRTAIWIRDRDASSCAPWRGDQHRRPSYGSKISGYGVNIGPTT